MKPFVTLLALLGLLAFAECQFRNPFQLFNFNGGNRQRSNDCGGCPCSRPNLGSYIVTWKLNNCKKFTHEEAANYCKRNNMKAISLDNDSKAQEAFGLLRSDAQRYFWTGGFVRHQDTSVVWPNGRTSRNIPFWSHTGGKNQAQPDNREGNEFCLAVLNNFYNDGIKYHDVSCHHKKPTICEP